MKKITALLLALMLSVSFVACDKDDNNDSVTTEGSSASVTTSADDTTNEVTTTPDDESTTAATELNAFAIIKAATEKSNNATKASCKYVMDMKMEMTGMTMDMKVSADIKADNTNPDKLVYRALTEVEMLGIKETVDMYAPGDGYVYYTDPAYSYKELDDGSNNSLVNSADMVKGELNEEMFKNATVTEGDKGYIIEITVSQDDFAKYFGSVSDTVGGSAGVDATDAEISDIKVSYTVDKTNSLVEMTVSFDMEITDAEMGTITTDATVILTDLVMGDSVVIEAPEGYENYEEFSFDDLEDVYPPEGEL